MTDIRQLLVCSANRRRFVFWLLFLPLFAAACVPRGVRLPQSPLLGTLERKSGRIAYVGIDGNIYTINQGGGDRQAITDDAHFPERDGSDNTFLVYRLPVWSPDSQQLAYVHFGGDEGAILETGLHTAAPDGSASSVIHTDTQSYIYLFWSPDGRRLAFLNSASGGPIRLQVIAVAPEGEEDGEARILDVGQSVFWDWAPNGRQLLTHIDDPAIGPRLAILSLEEPVVEEVLDLEPGFFLAPDWSPDGTQLLVATHDEGSGEVTLTIVNRNGEVQSRPVVFESNSVVSFDWSPDGKKIAYVSSEGLSQTERGPLTVIDPQEPGAAAIYSNSSDPVVAYFWSPDGKKIAYFTQRFIMPDSSESEEGNQENGSGQNQIPILTPYVLDVETGESLQLTDPYVPTPQFLQVVAFFSQYQRSATIWSPDSEDIVISVVTASGQASIRVVSASGNLEPRSISDGVLAFWSWQ